MSALLRSALRALGLAGLALAGASTAQVRTQVTPYLEVEQVVTADLNADDVLTYTSLAAGIDAAADTRRVQGRASYRYERRIAWEDDIVDEDVHSGLAAARVQLVPDTLVFDAGALAATARADGDGPILGVTSVNDPNSAEVFSAFAGPSLTTNVGPVDVSASYRLGYVHVDDDSLAGIPLAPGAGILDRYDSSTTHDVAVSVGMSPGELPFGWTVGAGYVREDVDRLDQVFEGYYVRGDIVVPVSHSLALTAGVGHEKIEGRQQDFQRDSAGVPIVTPGGNLIPNPALRLLTYEEEGLFWDAGVIYRPSRRTELQARVGERYGSTSVTGSFRHQFNSAYGVTAVVYDSVDSFGRLVVSDLRGVPTDFEFRQNPLNSGFAGPGGCVFGGGEPGSGVCFDDALQSITTGNFRNRGGDIIFSGGRGPWSFSLGAGYANRRYHAPRFEGNMFVVDRITDESYNLYAGANRDLSRTSSFGIDAYASWYDSDFAGSDQSFGTGLTGSYYQSFLLDRMQLRAAAGIYHTETGEFDSTFISGLVGLRYSF